LSLREDGGGSVDDNVDVVAGWCGGSGGVVDEVGEGVG